MRPALALLSLPFSPFLFSLPLSLSFPLSLFSPPVSLFSSIGWLLRLLTPRLRGVRGARGSQARGGFAVTGSLASAIRSSLPFILNDTMLMRTFAPGGRPAEEGEVITRRELADTLDLVGAPPTSALVLHPSTAP